MPPASQITLFVVAGILFLVTAFFTFMVVTYRQTKLIKASQPPMMAFILFGEILGGIRVIVAGLPITDATCTAGLWLAHMAFVFVFGALFIKTWRINAIINGAGLKRVRITSKDVLRLMLVVILFFSVYMALLTGIGKPQYSTIAVTVSNQTTHDVSSIHKRMNIAKACLVIIFCVSQCRCGVRSNTTSSIQHFSF
jgi:gamma-aminobutyric acid type B receptor